MKGSIICVALVLTFAAFFHSIGAQELCANHLCLPGNQCESFADSGRCPTPGHSCCREVRSTFRTKCRQFGGDCMNQMHRCNPRLIARAAQDCTSDEVCCVLI